MFRQELPALIGTSFRHEGPPRRSPGFGSPVKHFYPRSCSRKASVPELKLGFRIKASRKFLGRNQKDFSKYCGLDRSYFGGIERGQRDLTFFSLCRICAGL